MINKRVKNIKTSSTVEMASKAIALKQQGVELIDFSVGEPDFPTAQHIKDAAIDALKKNYTKYTANNGMQELRLAVSEKLSNENHARYTPEQILVSCGAKHSLFNVMMALIEADDEVIIPSPYWSSYKEITHFARGKAVLVETEEANGFHITADQLDQSITASTRLFILCNPTNPTGAGYSADQLKALANVLVDKDIFIISDEIYEKLFFDNLQFVSFASLSEEIKQRTVLINGLSKAYAMTGWRIGYAAGPAEIISGAAKIQSHSTSAASTISQYAALAALTGPQQEMKKMIAEFQQRRDYLTDQFRNIPGISCNKPQGAFYIFPNISSFFGKEYKGKVIKDSYDFSAYLLEEAKVVVVPGAGFGANDFIRISYSTSMDNIKAGIARIKKALTLL